MRNSNLLEIDLREAVEYPSTQTENPGGNKCGSSCSNSGNGCTGSCNRCSGASEGCRESES